VENTRTKIMDILRRRREATVDELTNALELAPATVRRHLDILQRDGYVKVRPVRRETGRPHYAFSLTESGEGLFPQHYIRITNRLMEEIVSLDSADTKDKSGQELAGLIFERMAERLARSYAPRVSSGSLAERIEQATAALVNEGLIFDVKEQDGSYVLLGRGCPCRKFAEKHPSMCSHDQKLLSKLLAADVEPVTSHGAADEAYCAYLVKEPSEGALPAPGGAV
jgi:DeoR family transcriptional regulator, suf operon transcriptional repressor